MKRLENIEVGELGRVLASSGQTLWIVSPDGTIVDAFGALVGELGFRPEELNGRILGELVDPSDLREAVKRFRWVAAGESGVEDFEIELRMVGRDGGRHEVKVNGFSITRNNDDETVIMGLTTDISRQKKAERTVERERLRFLQTFENAPNGIVLLHIDPERGGIVKGANAAACRIMGRPESDLIDRWLIDGELTELDDAEVDEAFEQSRAMFEGEHNTFMVHRIVKRPDGSRVPIKAAISALESDGRYPRSKDQEVNAIVHIEDVTEQRQAQDELQHQARHDSLTDLLNRRHFISLLNDRLERSWSGHGGGALMMIDLDDFKVVNDSHGHLAGDAVLKEVARILRYELRETDPVARLGGDEFAVLLPKIDRIGAGEVAVSLLRAFEKAKIRISEGGDEHFQPSVSIGVVMLEGRRVDAESALSDCDQAMYDAKRQGGARCVISPD